MTTTHERLVSTLAELVRCGWRGFAAALVLACAWLALGPIATVSAQELPRVVINEVISENGDVPPLDHGGPGLPEHTDMVELYNDSDELVVLGTGQAATSWFLSDGQGSTFDPASSWQFPGAGRSVIPPGGFLTIFLDGDAFQGVCELHATFALASDGTEPVSLWGPEDENGNRPLVDRIWLPPLRSNVSIGRSPDGAGPAPIPIDETLDHLFYFALGSESPPTFGECVETSLPNDLCSRSGGKHRLCSGAPNGPGTFPLEPRIERARHSTNHPAAMEPVQITARIRDDRSPTPESIASAQIVYRVDGGEPQTVDLVYDAATGVLPVLDGLEPGDPGFPASPLDRITLWRGTIPGQPAGARVEFHLRVEDHDGLSSTEPRELCGDPNGACPDCTGPCDRDFGGPDCQRDLDDVTCDNTVFGERYIECENWFTYVSGYERRPELAGLVINELVADQRGVLEDKTETRVCRTSATCLPNDNNCCLQTENPKCCVMLDDYIELYNSSDVEISLAGLWLSDSPFRPQEWQFPPGSKIRPGEYLIVWIDNDGGRCPDPFRNDPPCYWECPDPTNPSMQEYHTDFALGRSGDEIYIFDTEDENFGVVHGVEWADGGPLEVRLNESISLVPDGDPNGCFVVQAPSPRAANPGEGCGTGEPTFRRGDSNADCGLDLTDGVFILQYLFVNGNTPPCLDAADANDTGGLDLTDAVYVLQYLFSSGMPPPAPGPNERGVDPTPDSLAPCSYPDC